MKYVYNLNEGNKNMRSILGGKGANLAQMVSLSLSVPSGFIISTDACKDYLKSGNILNDEVVSQVYDEVVVTEQFTGKSFGNDGKTLLFSVRSGAPVSMPGMMDTILNLGLNDELVLQFGREIGNMKIAYDCYRRLIQMYGNVVKKVSSHKFEKVLSKYVADAGVSTEYELDYEQLKQVVKAYKDVFYREVGQEFPQDVKVQLLSAVEAVFASWNNDRAIVYRKINNIADDLGTAVVVQEMVFGNYNDNSATGVLFSRDPNTGEKLLYGEFLVNAQGEDVVAGIRTPLNINEMKSVMPNIYNELVSVADYLEKHYNDMQDIEFTVEDGKLFILQTRSAKRSSKAKVKLLLDLYNDNLLEQQEFVSKIDVVDIEAYLFSKFDSDKLDSYELFISGLPASAGAVSGVICLDEEAVLEAVKVGNIPVLVRNETSPEDITSMHHSKAILTAFGGMTSHAAVIARGMGKCCVCGANGLIVNEARGTVSFDGVTLKAGDVISVDGASGNVYIGSVPVKDTDLDENFYKMMEVIDNVKKISVYANGDDEDTMFEALKYGAEGVGLVRTEHMFFDDVRLLDMQSMILSSGLKQRKEFLQSMLSYQKDDFLKMLNVMEERPVAIRLLDPPLHEFLPSNVEQIELLADKLNLDVRFVKEKIKQLKEENPMLGHRGCRLAITYPEIYQMQVQAIALAVNERLKQGLNSNVKIIVPLISIESELTSLKDLINKTIDEVSDTMKNSIQIGAMIETPRAVYISYELANHVDFFSYGTNDLTQLTYGFSRDDVAKFIGDYEKKEVITKDPFVTLDTKGVGNLVRFSNNIGKQSNVKLETGICGEHGGDFDSVQYACDIGLNYVSCGPKRIPLAKLAAAKAAIVNK